MSKITCHGMDNAPEVVQLAFEDMAIAPPVAHDQTAGLCGSIPPGTNGVFVDPRMRAAARIECPSANAQTAISKIAGSACRSKSAVLHRIDTLLPQALHQAGWCP